MLVRGPGDCARAMLEPSPLATSRPSTRSRTRLGTQASGMT